MSIDKKRLFLIAVVVLLAIVLAVLVIVAMVDLKERKNDASQVTTAPTIQAQEGEDVVTVTPYGNLVFPGKWARYLEVERTEDPELKLSYIAKMDSGKTQRLFDLRFGEPIEPAIGQLINSDGIAVGVYVTEYNFSPDGSWPIREADVVRKMQECLEDVIAGLNLMALGTPIPELQGEQIVIDTPHGKLYFPGKWSEELSVSLDQSDGYSLTFIGTIAGHEPVSLFVLNFGGSEENGRVVHTKYTDKDIPYYVRLRTVALQLEGWSAVDKATVMAMQEDVNQLLTKLREE